MDIIERIHEEEAQIAFFLREEFKNMFVRIGKRVINLNNVTEMHCNPDGGYSNRQPCVVISFVGETENYINVYKSEQPEAFAQLMTWMDERPHLLQEEI